MVVWFRGVVLELGCRLVYIERVRRVVIGDLGGVFEVPSVFCSVGNANVDSELFGAGLNLDAFLDALMNYFLWLFRREDLNGRGLFFLGKGLVPREKLDLDANLQGGQRAKVFQNESDGP